MHIENLITRQVNCYVQRHSIQACPRAGCCRACAMPMPARLSATSICAMTPNVGPMWKRITSAQRSQRSDKCPLRRCSRPSLAATTQWTCESMLDIVTQIKVSGLPWYCVTSCLFPSIAYLQSSTRS